LELHRFIDIKTIPQAEVKWMFFLTALATSLEVFCLVFFVGAYARNRLYTERIARIFSPFTRFLFIWGAFMLWKPSIVMLGMASLIGA
jgi:hypothetical protein